MTTPRTASTTDARKRLAENAAEVESTAQDGGAMSLYKGHSPAEEFAVVIAALLAGRIDGQQAVASCTAVHTRLAAIEARP